MNNNAQRSIVEQTIHNATSWLGHRNFDDKDIIAGQTFLSTAEGDLESIEVYSTVVTRPGKVVMTLYEFDEEQNRWGRSLGSADVNFTKDNNDRWIAFYLNGLHLNKGKTYGFKLESNDTYIGVGEAAISAKHPPLHTGKEWKFENNQQQPYSYFSLAFKVGLKAA